MARARILIADDHKDIRDIAARLLEPEFEVVAIVEDGAALLNTAFQMSPDVCVTDISMPKLNGIEAAAQLKQSGSKSEIVFLTVHDDPDFVRAALDAGALGYVVKSRMASELNLAVKKAIAGLSFVSPPRTFIPPR